MLAWYQTLIQLKKTNPAFAHGDNVMLDTTNTKVLSWMRQTAGAPTVVVSRQLYRRSADGEPERAGCGKAA